MKIFSFSSNFVKTPEKVTETQNHVNLVRSVLVLTLGVKLTIYQASTCLSSLIRYIP